MTAAGERPAVEPLHFDLGSGAAVSGVRFSGGGRYGVVLLHDEGRDLDSVLPLAGRPGLAYADLVALDLPGHGLSSDAADPEAARAMLAAALERLARLVQGRFVLAGFGRSAALAGSLCGCGPAAGLVAVGPCAGAPAPVRSGARLPVLGFVSSVSPGARDDWLAFRAAVGGRWQSVELALPREELAAPSETAAGTIASHLGGFAREVTALAAIRARAPSAPSQ